MRRITSQLFATGASLVIIYYLQFSQDFVRKCDVKKTSLNGSHMGVYIPLVKLYPPTQHERKVDLSITIICLPTDHHIEHVKATLGSTTTRLKQMSTLSFKLFVGILSQNINGQELVRNAFKSYMDKFRIQFVAVREEDIEMRLNSSDISLAYRLYHRDFIRRRIEISMLHALLLWKASHESNYVLFAGAMLRPNKNFLESLRKAFNEFHKNQNVFTAKLIDNNNLPIGSIYRATALDVYTEYMFYMSPFKNINGLSGMFFYFGVGYKNIQLPSGFDVYDIPVGKLKRPNPPAVHSTNIFAQDPYFSSLPYEKGTKFWAEKVDRDSQFAIKFKEPIIIKSIRIITGLDIYLNDPVTRAVLEESSEVEGGNCGRFKELSDFRAGYIDMKLNRKTEVTTCLRVRFLSKEEQWVSIQMIEVLT